MRISFNEQSPLIELVDRILSAKQVNPKADTSALEREIDQLVYELYGLTKGGDFNCGEQKIICNLVGQFGLRGLLKVSKFSGVQLIS